MTHLIRSTVGTSRTILVLVFAALTGGHPAMASVESLSDHDLAGIRGTIEAYRRAWLAGDATGVLATFTDDAVLLPHHGDEPVSGIEAIRAYWFPASAGPTRITELTLTIEAARGTPALAFVYGRDTVTWTTSNGGVAAHYRNAGTYLNVMEKSADGVWRIRVHMWDDPANVRMD